MAVNKLRPTKVADNTSGILPTRTSVYNEATVLPYGVGRTNMADEGSYFVAQNATPGTALTGHVAPAFADAGIGTKSIIHFYNGGTLDVYLDYIQLTCPVANASATAVYFMAWTDIKGSTCLTSGGTAITSIYPTRSNSSNTTGITLTAGACVTAPQASGLHRVLQKNVKPYIGVALDSYSFVFGNGIPGIVTGFALTTAVTHTLTACAPVVVAPGSNFLFAQVGPSGASTAMTFEFEMGYWER